jgi:tetratricopeptide (TPR) repeat protein
MSDDSQPFQARHRHWEENPSEQWMYALEHMNTGQFELAVKHCQRAIEIWPDYYDAWLLMASALEKMDRLDEALEAVQRASEIAIEELSQAWNNQAFLHVARGEYEDALTVDRVLDLVDPTRHGIVRYRMAIAHAQMDNLEDALTCLAEAFRFRPELRERAMREPLLEPVRAHIQKLAPPE